MTYHRPRDLPQALQLLASGGLTILAGGTDLVPATDARRLDNVLDLTALPDLAGITGNGDGVRIGAATSWDAIARADLPPAFQALQLAAREVGSVQIQNAGTIGGNICNASPAADGLPPLLVLDAQVELVSARGRTRHLPLADFVTGVRQTARRADEILAAIHIPEASIAGQSRFGKLGARRYLVISTAMAAIRIDRGRDHIRSAAISVGACSPVARRLAGTEAALIAGGDWRAALDRDAAETLAPIDDIRADVAYRRGAAVELVSRLIDEGLA